MLASQAMPAMAADDVPTSESASGNILAYKNETYIVPTTIKVAFNPDQLDVTTRGTVSDNSQIVSLGYGVASEATDNRLLKITLETEGQTATGEDRTEEVKFAASANEVDEAEEGDLIVYLAVATSDAKPTTSDNQAFKVENHVSTASANALADVTMNPVSANAVALKLDDEADVTVSLNKAKYVVSENSTVTFETTQAQLKDMMVLDEVNGIAGFKFVGKMNADADWTSAKIDAIKITATYDFTTKANKDNNTLVEGTWAQVAGVASGPKITMTAGGLITMSGMTAEKNFKNLTIGSGEDLNNVADGSYTQDVTEWSDETGGTLKVQLGSDFMNYYNGKDTTATLILSDDSKVTVTTKLVK
jgi:hypothetical protein